ncbi:MAG: hypothetical protein Q7J82_06530 [Coriobacteriia bacterium]|nr:hypothetical protein [Coriobacteriia bacterium]
MRVSRRERTRSWLAAASLLLLVSLTACSASGTQPDATGAVADSPVVKGPYTQSTPVHEGFSVYELVSVEIGGSEWVRLSERMSSGMHQQTRAQDGYRYVDATIVTRNISADPNDANAPAPPHGQAFVMSDGQRFDSIDSGEGRQSPDLSVARLTYEFELPQDADEAVLHLPTSEEATCVISFRLW